MDRSGHLVQESVVPCVTLLRATSSALSYAATCSLRMQLPWLLGVWREEAEGTDACPCGGRQPSRKSPPAASKPASPSDGVTSAP